MCNCSHSCGGGKEGELGGGWQRGSVNEYVFVFGVSSFHVTHSCWMNKLTSGSLWLPWHFSVAVIL